MNCAGFEQKLAWLSKVQNFTGLEEKTRKNFNRNKVTGLNRSQTPPLPNQGDEVRRCNKTDDVCVNVTLRRVRVTIFAVEAISITYSEFVSVALVILHLKRMRGNILSSVACPALPRFSTLSHKRRDFREKLLNIKCVFSFSPQNLSEVFLILRRIQRGIIIYVLRSSSKVPVILVRF
jgi:hypothetical protein